MKYTKVKGTRDILPEEWLVREYIEQVAKDTAYSYGYGQITTPILEDVGLFIHSVGDSSDIVTKEMYTLTDKGNRDLVLIPEGTAGVCRAYLENNMTILPKPVKLFYLQRLFRYERPQKGRYREFSQFGVECFGSDTFQSDAEIISIAYTLLKKMQFTTLQLHINSLGCEQCRVDYREVLVTYFTTHKSHLCEDCQERLQKNPLRILDCKNPICKKYVLEAPKINEYLCSDCREHFQSLLALLTTLSIPFQVDSALVRGLDYYSRTVFEIISQDLGAQGTVLGGGRYDGLIHKELGGPPTPSIGFAMGIERITMLLANKNHLLPLRHSSPSYYITNFGKETTSMAFQVAESLRNNGAIVWMDLEGKGMKKVFENAEKRNSSFLIVIGEEETKTKKINIRNMNTRESFSVDFDDIMRGDLT